MITFEKFMHSSMVNRKYLTELFRPIQDLLGIHHITIYNVSSDNRVLVLDNDLEYLNYYFTHAYYTNDPHLLSYSDMGKGFVLWSDLRDIDSGNKWLKQYRSYFKSARGLTVVKKSNSQYQAFAFCSYRKDEKILNSYYNYYEYFEEYIRYFQKKTHHILEDMSKNDVNLFDLIGDNEKPRKSITYNSLTAFEERRFLQMLNGDKNHVYR